MESTPDEREVELRQHILSRAQAINVDLVTRLATVADCLAGRQFRAALDTLGGFERELRNIRIYLLLLEQE